MNNYEYVYTLFGLAIVESKASKKKQVYAPLYSQQVSALVLLFVFVFVWWSSLLSSHFFSVSDSFLFCFFVFWLSRQHFYTFMLLAFNWISLESQTLTSSVMYRFCCFFLPQPLWLILKLPIKATRCSGGGRGQKTWARAKARARAAARQTLGFCH